MPHSPTGPASSVSVSSPYSMASPPLLSLFLIYFLLISPEPFLFSHLIYLTFHPPPNSPVATPQNRPTPLLILLPPPCFSPRGVSRTIPDQHSHSIPPRITSHRIAKHIYRPFIAIFTRFTSHKKISPLCLRAIRRATQLPEEVSQ